MFLVGDFFEAYVHDAEILAEKLGSNMDFRFGLKMVAFPYHYEATYLSKLVALGYRVAICEQVK